jgi:hypothetical protein
MTTTGLGLKQCFCPYVATVSLHDMLRVLELRLSLLRRCRQVSMMSWIWSK